MNNSQFKKAVKDQAAEALKKMRSTPTLKDYVDHTLKMPKPFHGSDEIKLVILGQDPTAGPREKRASIKTVLKLDTKGPLKQFVENICCGLGINLSQVYATNVVKCFFREKPTMIQRICGADVIAESAQYWMPILRYELKQFPDAIVISLGQPVLKVLVKDGCPKPLRYYWGHHRSWQKGKSNPFSAIEKQVSEVDRCIYPFCHQTSIRVAFYQQKMNDYLEFIKK